MIKILKEGIELSIVSSTLRIVSKNTVFSDTFSLEYSNYPFLILEDLNTIKALGTRHISSLQKKISYDVMVIRGNKTYYGKLKVLSYPKGARKCDLVFGSDLLKVLDTPIKNHMQTIHFGRHTAYSEEVTQDFNQSVLINSLRDYNQNTFPDSDFKLPMLNAPDFLDVDKNENEWKDYLGFINYHELGKLKENTTHTNTSFSKSFDNYNVVHPAVYLLSMFRFLKSVNYTLTGDFSESTLIKNLVVLSKNNNNSRFKLITESLKINIANNFHIEERPWFDDNSFPGRVYHKRLSDIGIGKFKINFTLNKIKRVTAIPALIKFSIRIVNSGKVEKYLFEEYHQLDQEFYDLQSDAILTIEEDFLNYDLEIFYAHNWGANDATLPETSNIEIKQVNTAGLQLIHPTFDLSRHVADWTGNDLLTNCKNLFNLKIHIDDSLKQITIDFADSYLSNNDYVDLSSYELEVNDYENNLSDAFVLKYADDSSVKINRSGIDSDIIKGEEVIEISNDFKTLPLKNGYHTVEKEGFKEGAILLITDSFFPFKTKEQINGHSLLLTGNQGIANKFWKDWVRFRQHSSRITLRGNISKSDVMKIDQLKKVYYQNTVFLVEELISKTNKGYSETELIIHPKLI